MRRKGFSHVIINTADLAALGSFFAALGWQLQEEVFSDVAAAFGARPLPTAHCTDGAFLRGEPR